MTVRIHSIETAVPTTVVAQTDVRDLFLSQPELSRLGQRLIKAVFDSSGIDTRHTVISEFGARADPGAVTGAPAASLYDPATNTVGGGAATGRRNDLYIERSAALFVSAAMAALRAAPGIQPADVTHVVTVSCTGFFAPGPDYLLVRELGLRPSTQRYHLGFMGCYGAFPALRAAQSFCLSAPDAVVLVVCAELCTLHLRSSNHPDTIVASSVFADGAAAAVVSARPAQAGSPVLELDGFQTVLTPVGEADMAWKIGDQGFEMVLSNYVPRIIERYVKAALEPLLAADPSLSPNSYESVDQWAVHPGGRSILDRVQQELGLSASQLRPSREVLRRYGNMSSATILFVLRSILHSTGPRPDRVCAMAFGPGLTVESALLTRRCER